MALVHSGWVNQKTISAAVDQAVKGLKPDVVRVRFSFGEDWSGDDAIFFRVVLSDLASADEVVGKVARRIANQLEDAVKADELGLRAYFDYRSFSEQTSMGDLDWE